MALNLVDIPQAGGGWFKPTEEATEYVAILIEIQHLQRQRPTDYGPKDSAVVDMTLFYSKDSLEAGTPDEIVRGTRVEQSILARDLFALGEGNATIVTLAQVPSKKPGQRPAWVWRQASVTAKKAVVEYAEAREAAIAEAVADAPSFDD